MDMEENITKDQVFIGSEPNPEKIEKVENEIKTDPVNGFWTSSYNDNYISEWFRWLMNQGYTSWHEGESVWKLKPEENEVFVMNDTDDIEYLRDNYPTGWRSNDLPRRILSPRLNYSLIAEDFDGVRMNMDVKVGLKMYWDVESTVWFDWNFSEVQKIGEFNEYVKQY